jgi:hypothetical protein
VAKLFTFAKASRTTAKRTGSPRVPKLRDEKEQGPFYVRGEKAGSKDEYYVGLALEKIEKKTGWTWDFQVPLYGGRRRRGGAVVDFLGHTPGRWTMIDPMGRVWHTGRREDRQQYERIAKERNWNLIAYFTDQHPTKEDVYAFLVRELHVM